MKRVLVTGGNGLLAETIRNTPCQNVELTFRNHEQFDLTNPVQIEQQLTELRPEVVINTAAYNQVDRCEIERDISWAVNGAGLQKLAELCASSGIPLVHFGTDYVFDGAKKSPYTEEDMPNPINHYAAGKLFGERAVLASSPLNLVLRTSWIFGSHPTQAKTFVHTVLKAAREGRELKSTTDQISVPTFVEDLAQWTLELVRGQFSGLVHAVNDEAVSRYDWTRAILEEAVVAGLLPAVPTVVPVTTAYFNSTMRRPNYTVLSNDKLARLLERQPGSWRAGLKKMLAHERRR